MTDSIPAGSKTLRVFAEVTARGGAQEQLWRHISDLVAPTRAEPGNISYDVLQDTADPKHFMFFEEWADQAAIDAHIASAHIATYLNAARGLVDGDLRVVTARALTA